MKNLLHKAYKYLLSFRKNDWTLKDYPIVFKDDSKSTLMLPERFKPIPWRVMLLGWVQMQGHGDTKEEAWADLQNRFNAAKQAEPLPRPGTSVPLVFASSEGLDQYSDIAREFFSTILNVDYDGIFVSDESSLWDFTMEENLDPYYKKIKDAYGVDISDTNGNFLEIFKKIE